MSKQFLSHRQLQTQRLSPQQIQLMKLLQIPTATLDQRIQEELEANPALDEGVVHDEDPLKAESEKPEERTTEEDFKIEFDDYLSEQLNDDTASYKYNAKNYSADNEDKTIPVVVEVSFHEHLQRQLGLVKLRDEKKQAIAKQIIGSVDEDGYLRREPDAIVNDLAFSQGIMCEEEEIIAMQEIVRGFEPAGVGAKDLQDCLSLQLKRKISLAENEADDYDFEEEEEQSIEVLTKALKIITKYFDEFAKKHYKKLQRSLKIDEEELKTIIDEVLKLNPKPASTFGTTKEKILYIIPDFIIQNNEGELVLSLNSRNAPDLHINNQYKTMLNTYKAGKKKDKKEKEAVLFIKQKIDSARWFIDAIKQRQDTMYRTMYSIMQYQYDFLLTGDEKKLRPMILKDIADVTGLDISTISRVANSKYVQTEFGTKLLKSFFSESMQTDSGEEVSTLEVKKILSEIIDEEPKKKPLSDEKLKDLLREKGYNIARRTVAKYREQLSIPVARLRKEL